MMTLQPVERRTLPRLGLSVFSFGSTRDREVLEIVLGRQVDDEDLAVGVIRGYQALRVKGEHFPVMAPAGAEDCVVGLLLDHISEVDARRLAFYVDGMFALEEMEVDVEGELRLAQVYSVSSPALRVARMAWSFGQFRHAIRPAYLEQIRAFMEGFDADQLDEG